MKRISLALFVVALCVPAPAPAATISKTQKKIVKCANSERAERGLSKLKVGKPLRKAARMHAKNMLRLGFFDHVDPRGRSPQDRVNIFQTGAFAVGENIAAGYPDVKSTCEGWMKSPGHRANILNPAYTHIGGGFARGDRNYGRYYVQVFGIKLPGLGR